MTDWSKAVDAVLVWPNTIFLAVSLQNYDQYSIGGVWALMWLRGDFDQAGWELVLGVFAVVMLKDRSRSSHLVTPCCLARHGAFGSI